MRSLVPLMGQVFTPDVAGPMISIAEKLVLYGPATILLCIVIWFGCKSLCPKDRW